MENRGQVDSEVSFYEIGGGHATFFTGDGLLISLMKGEDMTKKPSLHVEADAPGADKAHKVNTETVRLYFIGAKEKPQITASDKQPGHVNYLVGNDRSRWRTEIPTYGAVTYRDVYKDIDIRFYGNNRHLEHDVIVRPGGSPSSVRFAYKGVKGLSLTKNGDLEVDLEYGKILEKKPVIYQEIDGKRVTIDGSYRIIKGRTAPFPMASTWPHTTGQETL